MDMDARREEYELRESKLTAEMEKLREHYEGQLSNMTKEYNEQLIQTVALQKELDQIKTELDALEGDNADLQDTINVMENNMAAVRNDFSSRSETAREDAMAQKEEYEMQLDRLHNELEEKKEELKKACHQNDLTKDTIIKLEQDLEGKIMMLDKATAEQQSTREMYENRIDRMRAESLNTKEIHMKEMGDLLEDNEIMKKELDDERMQKRSAEYRVRRLEEEMEMGKELLEQAKKDAESSKEEYEVSESSAAAHLIFVLRFITNPCELLRMTARHGGCDGQNE
jgi:chromosome segregation ATPase